MSKIKSYYEDLYGENWTDRVNGNNDNYEEETNGSANN